MSPSGTPQVMVAPTLAGRPGGGLEGGGVDVDGQRSQRSPPTAAWAAASSSAERAASPGVRACDTPRAAAAAACSTAPRASQVRAPPTTTLNSSTRTGTTMANSTAAAPRCPLMARSPVRPAARRVQ